MRKAILFITVLCFLQFTTAALTIGEFTDTNGYIELNPQNSSGGGGGNVYNFNVTGVDSTIGNATYWKLDGTNAPPSADWNMNNRDLVLNASTLSSINGGLIRWDRDSDSTTRGFINYDTQSFETQSQGIIINSSSGIHLKSSVGTRIYGGLSFLDDEYLLFGTGSFGSNDIKMYYNYSAGELRIEKQALLGSFKELEVDQNITSLGRICDSVGCIGASGDMTNVAYLNNTQTFTGNNSLADNANLFLSQTLATAPTTTGSSIKWKNASGYERASMSYTHSLVSGVARFVINSTSDLVFYGTNIYFNGITTFLSDVVVGWGGNSADSPYATMTVSAQNWTFNPQGSGVSGTAIQGYRFNNNSYDTDFQVGYANSPSALFIEGSSGYVAINHVTPETTFSVNGTIASYNNAVKGAEQMATGDFATAGAWVYGTGWNYDSVFQRANKSIAGTGLLQQDCNLQTNHFYVVNYSLIRTAGGVRFIGGGFTSQLRNTNGNFSEMFMATTTTNCTFTPSATAFRGWIDDVSVKEVIDGNIIAAGKLIGNYGNISYNLDVGNVTNSLNGYQYKSVNGYSGTVNISVMKTALTTCYLNTTYGGGLVLKVETNC